MTTISFTALVNAAATAGFAVAGVFKGDELDATQGESFRAWIKKGYMGEMSYLSKGIEEGIEKRIRVERLNAPSQSLVLFAARYEQALHPELKSGSGRVARYAWGKDYHRQIPKKIEQIVKALFPDQMVEHKVFSDATPLLERAFAQKAGLGFIGKNTLLITPKVGSLFLLGGVLLGVEVVKGESEKPKVLSAILDSPINQGVSDASCGSCSRCIEACPTKAIVEPYTVDARRCISYLTIELRRAFTDEEKEMIGEWIFGCDICQDVCPHNHATLNSGNLPLPLKELTRSYGCGPLLDLKEILELTTDEAYLKRFAGTPVMRAKRVGLIRNALCVAANTDRVELLPLMREVLERESSEVIKDAARWALQKLALKQLKGG
jgi:epoxyqueuosine reductase